MTCSPPSTRRGCCSPSAAGAGGNRVHVLTRADNRRTRLGSREACLFKTYHGIPFSEVIPKILRLAGHWSRGLAQYERVLRTFAWITGDKPIGDYEHTDVAKYKNALLQMPRDYRRAKDFDKPFEKVALTLKVSGGNARSISPNYPLFVQTVP